MATTKKKFKGTATDRIIAAALVSDTPVMLWGQPGIGKSAYITAMAKGLNAHLEVLLASIRESQDFLGLPIERNGVVEYAPGAWVQALNSCGATRAKTAEEKKAAAGLTKSVLFLDEATTIDESTMKGMLRVVNERWVGEVPLAEHVRIILAGNDPDHAVDGVDLPAPMANRMLHLDFKLDAERWADGLQYGWDNITVPPVRDLVYNDPASRRATVAAAVAQYTRSTGIDKALNPPVPEDASAAGKAWASPRTWTLLTDILAHVDMNDYVVIEKVARGLVGDAQGSAFASFLKKNDLIDPMKLLTGELTMDWNGNHRIDQMWMLCNGLAAIGLDQPEYRDKALDLLLDCALANQPDVAQRGAQMLNKGRLSPELSRKFNKAFKGMLENSDFRVVDELAV